jgi:hypothetical protein
MLTYWMSHGCKHSIGPINKRCWRRSDSDVHPFILLRIRDDKINSIIGIPCFVLKIEDSRIREIQPERILAESPPLKPVVLQRSIFVGLQTDVKLGFIIYTSQNNIFLIRLGILTV